jgi:hypothetical protein
MWSIVIVSIRPLGREEKRDDVRFFSFIIVRVIPEPMVPPSSFLSSNQVTHSANRSLFHKVGIREILNKILLQNPGQFTKMNILSIVRSLGKFSEV